MARAVNLSLACVLAAAIWCGSAAAQVVAPFSFFQSRSAEQMARLQIRITYVGPKTRSFPSLALSLPGDTLDPNLPRYYHRPKFKYPDTSIGLVVCPITTPQLKAALDSVATLPDVVDGDVDSLALFSFAMVDTSGGEPHWFESILDETSGMQLVSRMAEALRDNPRAASAMATIACGLRVQSPDLEGEVTKLLAVTLARITPEGSLRRLTARLRVVNMSRDTIPGPLVVVLETRPAGVRVVDADGYTCRVFYPGCPFVLIRLENPLAPRAVAEREVRFENPRQQNIRIAPRVFMGLADR
jgi:hypothetical protein